MGHAEPHLHEKFGCAYEPARRSDGGDHSCPARSRRAIGTFRAKSSRTSSTNAWTKSSSRTERDRAGGFCTATEWGRGDQRWRRSDARRCRARSGRVRNGVRIGSPAENIGGLRRFRRCSTLRDSSRSRPSTVRIARPPASQPSGRHRAFAGVGVDRFTRSHQSWLEDFF